MLNDKEEKNYYIYDEKKKEITSIYIPKTILGNSLAVITVPDSISDNEAWKSDEIKIGDEILKGFSFKDKA